MSDVIAAPFPKPDIEDEVLALAESLKWPTIRGLVGGGDDGLHWRRRIRWFTSSQLAEAHALLLANEPPFALEAFAADRNGRSAWEHEKASRNGASVNSARNSRGGTMSAGSGLPRDSRSTSEATTIHGLPGPETDRPHRFWEGIDPALQIGPSNLIYKGVPLVWKSQEIAPEHVFHWDDDPRKHPWCLKCRQRRVPQMAFSGTPTAEPPPPQPSDWAVKE